MIRHIRAQAHQLASREDRLRARGLAGIGQTRSLPLGVSPHHHQEMGGRRPPEQRDSPTTEGERLYLIPAVAPRSNPVGLPTQDPAAGNPPAGQAMRGCSVRTPPFSCAPSTPGMQ